MQDRVLTIQNLSQTFRDDQNWIIPMAKPIALKHVTRYAKVQEIAPHSVMTFGEAVAVFFKEDPFLAFNVLSAFSDVSF